VEEQMNPRCNKKAPNNIIRKQKNKCNTNHIQKLLKNNNEVIGFKCQCGYEFKQKRLITQEILKEPLSPQKPTEDKEK